LHLYGRPLALINDIDNISNFSKITIANHKKDVKQIKKDKFPKLFVS